MIFLETPINYFHAYARFFSYPAFLSKAVPSDGHVAWLPHSSAYSYVIDKGLFDQLLANAVLFKSCSSLRPFLSLFV